MRITALCLRWKYRKSRPFDPQTIEVDELDAAHRVWIEQTQLFYYSEEIRIIKSKNALKSSVNMAKLCPQLDNFNLLRVGGRLQGAELSLDQKHPYIIPANGHFTWLVIENAHKKNLHAGIQGTLQYIRQTLWIIGGRNVVKAQINKCITCIRFRAALMKQQMGRLPPERIRQCRPFANVGIDYAGYFDIKTSTRRNSALQKCYIALFVCMATKAIHLELVSSLSTKAFLAAFKRFVSRRGIPQQIFSDRGTNFIGANRELPKALYDTSTPEAQEILSNLSRDQIKWNFNPARAPHFGGLWEASVKSVKFHLKRVLFETKLCFEEFNTLLIQIEAILNSRPLCALTADPDDIQALTPGHFIIGQALNTLPEQALDDLRLNRLDRYQLIQLKMHTFWKKWSHDYLTTLQQRSKWLQKHQNITEGQLVLIREDNIPPSRWLMGRIIKVFFGPDQLVRVVDVKCRQKVLRRSIHKLCHLPIDQSSEIELSFQKPPGEC